MNYRRLNLIGVAVFMFLFSLSCDSYMEQFNMDKLSTEVEITPSFVAPVAYGNFSIQDILETLNDSSGLLEQGADSLIYIYFEETAFSLNTSELITIPDNVGSQTYFSSDINIPAWIETPVGTQYTFYKEQKVDFILSADDRIDSIFLKSGNLILAAHSEFKHPGNLLITSSNIIDPNGDSLVLEILIGSSDGTFSETSVFDLADHKLILTKKDDEAFVLVNLNLTLNKTAAGISSDESAGLNLNFTDIDYKSLFGLIAEREITDLSQSIDIGFFESLDNLPDIHFADPQFTISVENSIGLPLSLDITQFRSRSVVSGEYIELTFKDQSIMPFFVQAPDIIGDSKTSVLELSVATCNIDELISNVPDKIELAVSAKSGNPPGSTKQNFLLDTSNMQLSAGMRMPFHFSTSGYTLRQDLDVDFAGLMENAAIIESAGIKLATINEWPLGVALQIYFQDDAGTIVDSLWQAKEVLLEAAPVDSNGELDRSALVENLFDVTITKEKIDELEGATKMSIEATVATTENGTKDVKFFSNYLLNYKVSIDAQFRINTSEL